ncbi:MAG: hypothetical protein L6Q35_01075 [Phycisphaerales bacterium]|nr:hypothetical protein [Phycisphaerales bacterium]
MALIRRADAQEVTRDALVLDLGDLARQGEAILRQARTRAAALIQDAQNERDRLIAGAREAGHDQGLAAGREAGLAKGLEAGRAQAVKENQQKIDALAKAWEAALSTFDQEREAIVMQARIDVLRLAVEIASRLTRRVIAADPGAVAQALAAALSLVMRPTRVRVSVNPADAAVAADLMPQLLQKFAHVRHAEINPDESIERGGCVVKAATGAVVDADISTQIDRVVAALLPPREDA